MNVIGLKCGYVGADKSLRKANLVVEGVVRSAGRPDARHIYLELDDDELGDHPVTPDDLVRVRDLGSARIADVRATDLDIFQGLAPRTVPLGVQLEEGLVQNATWAARRMGRPLDAVISDAIEAHLRTLGVGRTTSRTLIGFPAVRVPA
jgi:hypothetical protein